VNLQDIYRVGEEVEVRRWGVFDVCDWEGPYPVTCVYPESVTVRIGTGRYAPTYDFDEQHVRKIKEVSDASK